MSQRSAGNDFVLAGDPPVWSDDQRAVVARRGDDGTNCVLCGKKTGGGPKTASVLVSYRATMLPVSEMPEDGALLPDGTAYDEGVHTLGCFFIGSECLKTVPAKYVIKPQGASA